ncbi:MAG: adenylosuccinate synthase [Gemmatimonadetes bacterium]|nr:adenylosuccinate synthase [Gemmatimonadota bacterium]
MGRKAEGALSGACTVVVGCQWGDEGKGKVVDVLARDAELIARYQGGANAGHTVHVGNRQVVLHQVPSGALHPGKRCLLGNGVVVDLGQLFDELDELDARGIDTSGRIGLSARAHVVFGYHKALDAATEEAARRKIGTTGKGIGPAYEAKTARCGVRVADLLDPRRAADAVERGLEWARRRLALLDADPSRAGKARQAIQVADRLPGLIADVGAEIADALAGGRRVLLEGAQGTALDVDHGSYPFVTSSNTTAGAAAVGVAIGPTAIDSVIGVVKAYTTRVGNGPLPTAFDPEMDERIRELGGEFGATTGRPRRCGWFDAPVAAYAARVNGLTGIAVTKLDVLDTLAEVRIAAGYRLGGETGVAFPATNWELEDVEPVYETLPGWRSATTGARRLRDLPKEARSYLERIEELVGTPIAMVSVGTRRSQVITEP